MAAKANRAPIPGVHCCVPVFRTKLDIRWFCALLLLCTLSDVHAQSWTYRKGRGYFVCDAVLKRLNSYKWTNDETNTFARSVVDTYPGWEEPPWQNLDPNKHKDLILELIRYQELGPDVYFGRKPDSRTADEQRVLNEALKKWSPPSDIEMRLWKTRLLGWLDEKPAPPTAQTIVQLRYRLNSEEIDHLKRVHPDKPLIGWTSKQFLVTDDLRGPDQRVAARHASDLAGSSIYIANGVNYFIQGHGPTMWIKRDFGSGPSTFCELNFGFIK